MLVTSGHDALADIGIEEDATFRQALEDAADWADFALAVAEQEPGPWRYQAACLGHSDVMFPERGQSVDPAKALCDACPVFDECRAWGDEHEPLPLFGFLAGESARARLRRRGRSAVGPRPCSVCGTEFEPARNGTTCSSTCRTRKSRGVSAA